MHNEARTFTKTKLSTYKSNVLLETSFGIQEEDFLKSTYTFPNICTSIVLRQGIFNL